METHEERIHEVLRRWWGFDSFRPVQEQIVRAAMEGRDTLALMPTGGGKAVVYQVPALASEGVCVVVTPLIALMKDQIDRLRRGENPTVDSSAETERKQNHAQTQRRGRKYLGKR